MDIFWYFDPFSDAVQQRYVNPTETLHAVVNSFTVCLQPTQAGTGWRQTPHNGTGPPPFCSLVSGGQASSAGLQLVTQVSGSSHRY